MINQLGPPALPVALCNIWIQNGIDKVLANVEVGAVLITLLNYASSLTVTSNCIPSQLIE